MRDTNVKVNHQLCQLLAIDQDDFGVDPTGIFSCLGCVSRRGDKHALFRPLPLQRADELLDFRTSNAALPSLRLNEDRIEAKAIFLDDSVDPAVTSLAYPLACVTP